MNMQSEKNVKAMKAFIQLSKLELSTRWDQLLAATNATTADDLRKDNMLQEVIATNARAKWGAVGDAVDDSWEAVKSASERAIDKAKDIASKASDAVVEAMAKVTDAAGKTVNFAKSQGDKVWEGIKDTANKVKDQTVKLAKAGAQWVIEQGKDLWDKLKSLMDLLTGLFDNLLVDTVKCLFDAAKDKLSFVSDRLMDFAGNPIQGIKSGIGRIENEFVDLMEKTTNRFAKHAELGWGLVSGDLNVTQFDKEMVNELKELGNEDKAFKCVLPAVEMLTSNEKINEHRQKLADKVREFFTDMTEKLVTKIVDFAVDKLIDGLDKILNASTLLQEIMDEVGNVVVGRLQQNMDAVTEVMEDWNSAKKGSGQEGVGAGKALSDTVVAAEDQFKNFWEAKNMYPTVLTALKNIAIEKAAEYATGIFYQLWDSLLAWGAPMILRVAEYVIDVACATANAPGGGDCEGVMELIRKVMELIQQGMREVGKKLILLGVEKLVTYLDDEFFTPNLEHAADKTIEVHGKTVAKVQSLAKSAEENIETSVLEPMSVPIPKVFNDIFNWLRGKAEEVLKRIVREALEKVKGMLEKDSPIPWQAAEDLFGGIGKFVKVMKLDSNEAYRGMMATVLNN